VTDTAATYPLSLHDALPILQRQAWVVADVPIGARPHFEYGSALQKEGRLEEAVEQYKIGLQFNPKDAKAHTSLAVALTGQAKFEIGRAHVETALRLEPNNHDFHLVYSNLLHRTVK